MYNNVICGDCLEVMKDIPDKSIDCIITDPPFGLPNEDFEMVKLAIKEMRRISKMQIIILDWRNPLNINDGKFAELIWEYGWISGGRTKSEHFYPTHNTIHFLGEELFSFDTKDGSIIKRREGFSSPRQCSYAKKSGHPFEKPVKLIEYLIKRCKGDTILDPFAGSGTTGVACKNLNRNFILIEKEQEYVKICKERLK
jgi:site-specific DNA-methyltransferase (adenine-specific)